MNVNGGMFLAEMGREIDPMACSVPVRSFPAGGRTGEDAMTLLKALLIPGVILFAAALPASAEGPDDILPEAPAKALVVRACTACHQAPMVVAKRRTAEEWDEMIGKMVDRGAALTDAEQDQVYDYLVKYFGPETPAAESKGN
jgi:hypothetical protein